ncbi:hypothetical protein EDC96DRAFT_517079 [Choanephora cucurbitarum]|nr:hypothetical protein EDC96DRAFT_517079 [Choanephora cucurbitarum]
MINTIPIETEFRQQLIQLIQFFQFSQWHAYGEAEAECAMLQRLGIVDLVLTGDSDVFLFGAQCVMRRWPSKPYEPVACFDQTWITDKTGLDRSDLILIALLRGSDYDTKGTRGIGTLVAAQLAHCHFHRSLMDDIQLTGREVPLDNERVQHMYDDLTYELQHNRTQNLSRKHAGVVLDPKFPDFSIVIDFIHPLTNIGRKASIPKATRLADNLNQPQEPQWTELARFCQHAFHWPANYLLKRFSSVLFPAYMINTLRRLAASQASVQRPVRLDDYYRDKARQVRQNIIVQVTAQKYLQETQEHVCRVEWDMSCWTEFLQLLKIKLDSTAYIEQFDNSEPEAHLFDQVKRQWIPLNPIRSLYPHLLSDKKNKKEELFSTSTVFIVPKRRQPL